MKIWYLLLFRMSKEEKKQATEKAQELLPGDLILIRTPSAIYDLMR